MRNIPFILVALYIFFFPISSMYGIGEKTISLGSVHSWELMEKRQGVVEAELIRPHSVLVLDSTVGFSGGINQYEKHSDLYLSFDEGRPDRFRDALGRYNVSVSPELAAVSANLSRNGNGAALFNGKTRSGSSEGILALRPGRAALFAPGNHIRSFSIEFWLYPQNLETGEQIFLLNASKSSGPGAYANQQIRCTASRNRLNWAFENFFFSPGERNNKALVLAGPQLLNRIWSHHLVRFDADLGLLEYLVDGRLEAVDYATSTGREGGEVYTPVIGEDCHLELGGHFSGIMDEFRIHKGWFENSALGKYSGRVGRAESRTLDLGNSYCNLKKIEAFGGRTGIVQNSLTTGEVRNEYAGNGALRFSDHAELKFYVRISNNPYHWNDAPWVPVNSGTELPESGFRGRYLQVASEFYPGWDGETTPYLSELRLIYNAAEPPPPPTLVTAVAGNGAVDLSWKASASMDVGGYMIYYGNAKGEYFGNHAVLDSAVRLSPINVGNRTTVHIEGLNNGNLYYFVVAAYNKLGTSEALPSPGEFSREAVARPLPAFGSMAVPGLQPAEGR